MKKKKEIKKIAVLLQLNFLLNSSQVSSLQSCLTPLNSPCISMYLVK